MAAWIYAVVNPIIDSLDREPPLLESGNLTWRAYLGRCEMINPIEEYIDPGQLPNYETFRAEHATDRIIEDFDSHDSTLRGLNDRARSIFERLTSSTQFTRTVESETKAYESARRHEQWAPPYIRTELPRFSAEYVINNIQSLPSHYATAEFWNGFGKKLLTFRNRPEFKLLAGEIRTLEEISVRLRRQLLEYRLSKSREYDVPAAPVPGLTLDAE